MLVKTQYLHTCNFAFECGTTLEQITLAYETFGQLNADKSNAVLVCHALTGDAHCAGKHTPEDKKDGWWDKFIGPNKAIDTNKFFVISSNVLGGCAGSTGPKSTKPQTQQVYGMNFPFVTIKDMVKGQAKILDELGIQKLHTCIGGSMGGMQALEWAITFPERCSKFAVLASAAYQSPQNIALHEVGRRAIMNDSNWQQGNYYNSQAPNAGLSVARMIAHISYLSDTSMHKKFGRRIQKKDELGFELSNEFEVESYLDYQGLSFIERFDANSYLYITRAVDYFDYSGSKLTESLAKQNFDSQTKFLIASFSSDWLYPSYQSLEIVKALQHVGLPVTYCEINSSYGHDAFLLETEELDPILRGFLAS